jgi:hypothetical protein
MVPFCLAVLAMANRYLAANATRRRSPSAGLARACCWPAVSIICLLNGL